MVLEPQNRRWPPGRPRLPQEFVDEHKRKRCALALSELVHERGAANLTVTLVAEGARMSRGTFYDIFGNCEEAFLYACEMGTRRLQKAVADGAEQKTRWEDRVESAIGALLRAAKEEPHLAELCLVHGSGRVNPGRCAPELQITLARVIGEGRAECRAWEPHARTEELLAGGVLSIISERLWQGEAAQLEGLRDELTKVAITPFLHGIEAIGDPERVEKADGRQPMCLEPHNPMGAK